MKKKLICRDHTLLVECLGEQSHAILWPVTM